MSILWLLQCLASSPALALSSADPVEHGDTLILETQIKPPPGKGLPGERFDLQFGFVSENEVPNLVAKLKKDLAKQPYIEVVVLTPEHYAAGRAPQALNFASGRKLVDSVKAGLKAAVVAPTRKIAQHFKGWLEDRTNRTRIGYAVAAGVVDGISTGAILVVGEGMPMDASLAVASTAALMSGSWSYFSPELARFFNVKASLVDRFMEKKKSLIRGSLKLFEGLLKWGVVAFGYFAAVGAVSQWTGVHDYRSLADYFLVAGATAAGITAGNGVLDYTLSMDLARIEGSPAASEDLKFKILKRTYFWGTIAAAVATLAGVAQTLEMNFGDVIIKSLIGAGIVNLARIEWKQIKRYYRLVKIKCAAALMSEADREKRLKVGPDGFPNWGSE
ncbi:MAG: hypothetical protein JNL01_12360 [Bdellovibrionales bacterium]|nr:hypothetical protein [Bdellovibrionales bacterium]